MRKLTKKNMGKSGHMTLRDADGKIREGLDTLRRVEEDDIGFPIDRTEMVRRLVERSVGALQKRN